MLPSRTLRGFALTLLLGAAVTAGAHQSGAYVKDLQNSLIAFAASDFAAHGPRPDGFRNVDLRYRENDLGARSYMLCGQSRVSSGPKPDWVDFATIKTSSYEQWIGGHATDMCARAVPVPADGKDLSSALQSALGGNAPATSTP
jgi:hypothetical protein